jgi:hypothetical protein
VRRGLGNVREIRGIGAWHINCTSLDISMRCREARHWNSTTQNCSEPSYMKIAKQMLMLAGVALLTCVTAGTSLAQQDNNNRGRGNFDPAQFRQNRMDDLRDQMEVKDDTEWKAIQPLIEKVFDAQQAVFRDRIGGMFGRSRRGGDRGGDSNNNSSSSDSNRRRSRSFGGEPSPEADALQKAIDGKASNSEMKAVLARFLEARKQKQADLDTAQANLRKVLSLRQEAVATASGLL